MSKFTDDELNAAFDDAYVTYQEARAAGEPDAEAVRSADKVAADALGISIDEARLLMHGEQSFR